MKVIYLFAAVFFLSFVSCSPRKDSQFVMGDYHAWNKPVSAALTYAVPGHENRYRIIFMNDIAWNANRGGALDFPKGSIIIKDIYAGNTVKEGEKPIVATFMYKDPENPEALRGWVWGMKDLVSGVENKMNYDFCITCHDNANEAHPYGDRNPGNLFRDFVFLPPGTVPENSESYNY